MIISNCLRRIIENIIENNHWNILKIITEDAFFYQLKKNILIFSAIRKNTELRVCFWLID